MNWLDIRMSWWHRPKTRRYIARAARGEVYPPSLFPVSCIDVITRNRCDIVTVYSRGHYAGRLILAAGDGATLADLFDLDEVER